MRVPAVLRCLLGLVLPACGHAAAPAGGLAAAPAGGLLLGTAADRAALDASPPPARYVAVARPLDDADVARMRAGGVRLDGCPVTPADLALLRFTHVTFSGGVAVGTLVVHRALAAELAAIFGELWDARFPIARAVPVEAYGASDDRSMADDNTSAYNCRERTPSVAAGQAPPAPAFSVHSYGAAIDVNPIENPYFKPASPEGLAAWEALRQARPGEALPGLLAAFCLAHPELCAVLPPEGRPFVDRVADRPGVIRADGPVVQAFRRRGWTWGGDWPGGPEDRVRTDTQHFEKDPSTLRPR